MTSSSSLYGTVTTQNSSSSNSTSLYGEAGTPIPDSSGNVVVRGDLYVLSGNILTTATTGNIFPANAETINLGLAATAVNIGAGTGNTTINNNLVVDGTTTFSGDIIAPGADLGNITVGVVNNNTIDNAVGALTLSSGANSIVLDAEYISSPNANAYLLNAPTTVVAFDSATSLTLGQTTGTTFIRNDTTVGGDLKVNGNDIKSSAGTTAITLSNNDVTIADTLTIGGTSVNLAQDTGFLYSENNDRLNRPYVKSTTGNASGFRVLAPNATTSAASTLSVGNTNDPSNTTFLSMQAFGSATDPLRILTGKYTAGVFGPSGDSIAIRDGATTYATINPAGPTIGTDLATKAYVDAQELNTTYTIDASTTTGGANFNLVGSDATTDTIKFAGSGATTVTRTDANTITIATTAADTTKLVNGAYEFVLNADGTVSTPSEITAPGPLTLRGGSLNPTTLVVDDTSVIGTFQEIAPGGDSATLTATNGIFQYDHTAGTMIIGSVDGTWSFNPDGTTSFPNYKFPYADGTSNQVLRTNGSGILSWYTPSDLNTTYTYTASATTGGANLTLTGSDSSVNTVKVSSGTGITVADVSSTEISITNAGVTSAIAGTGIGVSGATGAVTISNTGVTSLATGTYLSVNASTGAVTVSTNATDANTVSTIVARDASGNFSASTGTFTGVKVSGSSSGSSTFTAPATGSTLSYVLPGAAGSANTVLTNDGSGNLTWALPGGGGSTFGNVSIGVDTDQTISTTSGNLILQTAAGVNAGTITLAAGANGNITLAPNGTGIVSSGVTQVTDGSRALGQLIASRSTTWTPPSSGLTTITGTNGIAVGSTTGYSPSLSATYYSGDTTAGTNTSAAIIGRGATGTNTTPTAAASGQVLATFNADGYATTGWAQTIATTGSGAGTTAISPAQLQFYTREAFADSAGSVTNAGTGMRVRLFNSATTMSTTNRVNIIDHTTTTATYKAATFNIQPASSTANYGVFGATGTQIGNTDNANVILRTRGASAGASPSLILRNTNTVAAAPATGDGTTFRFSTAGSNATNYTIADYAATYSSTGDNNLLFQVANGDQTGAVLSSVTLINSKPSVTTINAGTPSATPGATTVSTVASFGATGSAMGYVDATVLLDRTTAGTPGVANQKNAFTIESRRSDQSGVTNTDTTGNAFRVGGTGNYYWTNQIQSQYLTSGDHIYTIQAAAGDQTSGSPTYLSLASFAPTQTIIRAGTAGSGGSTATKLTVDANKITAAVPVVFPSYTKAQANALTGAIGWQIAISDSAAGSNPNGMMAFWDTTNSRWSYVHDNSAV